ncbi:MAG: histidine kinase [Thermotogae bacterium]|nr:histidine kinase [Thermotogota bacterium]
MLRENFSLLLLERLALMTLIMYLLLQSYVVKRALGKTIVAQNSIFIGIFGGIVGILGSHLGISYKGAIMNYRDMGVIVAGIVGGFPSGVIAGLIAGIHRFFLGGVSALPCMIGTIAAGVITGAVSRGFGHKVFNWWYTPVHTAGVEFLHLYIARIMISPPELARDIVHVVLFPMVVANVVGVMVLNAMLRNIEEFSQEASQNAIESLFPILEASLHLITSEASDALEGLCKEIVRRTSFDAVVLSESSGSNVYVEGDRRLTKIDDISQYIEAAVASGKARKVLRRNPLRVSSDDVSALVFPLKGDREVFGALALIRHGPAGLSEFDILFSKRLAQIISLVMYTSKISKELAMANEARTKEFLAKISPHFLFNTLNTLRFFTKRDVNVAVSMIDHISEMLRYLLSEKRDKVSVETEMAFVENYLQLMKLRYGDNMSYELMLECGNVLIPPFVLQPLVENALVHGRKNGTMFVGVKVYQHNSRLVISVRDRGPGLSKNVKWGTGLKLIKERLENLYGDSWKMRFINNDGLEVKVVIPMEVASNDQSGHCR